MNEVQQLAGYTILFGREPGLQSRLLVCMQVDGQMKTAVMGTQGCVPQSVSRCVVESGSAHASLSVSPTGQLQLTNLKPKNTTRVNGVEVSVKSVDLGDKLSLGKDNFSVDVQAIVKVAAKLLPQKVVKPSPVSIAHLKEVWEEYETTISDIQKKRMNVAKQRTLPMVLTFASAALAGLFRNVDEIKTVGVIVAVICAFLWIKTYFYKDTTYEESKAADDKLIDKYICPNPQCKHYLGKQPYKVLRQNKKCGYCGTPWTS